MSFGDIALAIGFGAGLFALVAYFLWARGNMALRQPARYATGIMALALVLAGSFHLFNIMTHQFQYDAVANFTDRSLPPLLLAASFWGGQSGSFLLWALWSSLFALILQRTLRHSEWEPYVLTPYVLIVVCIVGIMWASEPFRMRESAPADGNGLNPLLQNYWMAIHPPILFTGFTTMAGPFAFAIAALWRRSDDEWVQMARPWALLAWICLGTGLALGGFWAYESLGWGGFWGWDPVENSSLVPWLIVSALLHGMILQSSRGGLKHMNLLLAIVGELAVIYSTFLTRSGILGKFSVHSFVELGLMGYLVLFIIGFALLGFGLLIWRWRAIGRRVSYLHVLSREFGLLVSTALFLIVMLIVAIGTSMPVISLLPIFSRQVSVDLSWYGPATAPFGVLIVFTMAVGPLLGWQRSRYGALLSMLKIPALFTGVALFICLLLDITYPIALLLIGGAVFAIGTNLAMIVRIWQTGPLRLGGYLCHVGVGILFLGIVGNAYYKQTAPLRLMANEPQAVFGRQFVFRDIVLPPDDPLQRSAVQIEVMELQSKQVWIAQAPYYIYQKSDQLVIHPAIQSNFLGDLYLEPSQYLPPEQVEPGVVVIPKDATREVLGYQLTFQRFDIPNQEAMMRGEAPPQVWANLNVQRPDGEQSTANLLIEMQNGQLIGEPFPLGDGASLTLQWVDPETQMIAVKLGGVDLSRIPAEALQPRLFVEVSYEPTIKLVWIGITVGVLGAVLSLIRRSREIAQTRRTLPRGLSRSPDPSFAPGITTITTESEVLR